MDREETAVVLRLERITEENKKQNAELIQALNRFGAVSAGTSSTSGVHVHADGIIAIIVGAFGILGVITAVAAVLVVWAWRSADMADLARVRGDVRVLDAQHDTQERRINKLEAENVK